MMASDRYTATICIADRLRRATVLIIGEIAGPTGVRILVMDRGTPMEPAPTSLETVAIPLTGVPISSTSSVAEEGRFVPGTLLGGRYRIIALLGRGGMGEVYRATDLMLGQSVALKFLPEEAAQDQRLLERFHGEVRLARQVSHPNVCRVYDIGEFAGMPFLSMEYVDGEDLASLLTRIGRLPADKAVETARKICAGLAAAHDRGIIHRDLKPSNIMINKRGDVAIMDFGLAAVAGGLLGSEARNGTPAYMSPEQLKGAEVTARSDIYALGLVLYELFTGKRPYDGQTLKRLLEQQEAAHLTSMTSIAADIDPSVERAIRRCLDPDPAKRPANALSVAAALPGGDPLAAALAAGETPSPELVAAAGETEGLPLKYSVPCLAAVVVCLFAIPLVRQRVDALMHAPVYYPPEVLAQKARDTALSFGYDRRPADEGIELNYRNDLLEYLKSLPEPRQWSEWLASEAPIAAVYRESPKALYAAPFGQLAKDNPAPVDPGMVSIVLDGSGRLREFSAVPYEKADGLGAPVSAATVFHAAGINLTGFQETEPAEAPHVPADELHAWKGQHPVLPHTEITVESGSWKGRITFFKVLFPWDKPASEKDQPESVLGKVTIYGLCVLLLFALLLARRNWKSQRADRKGAFRITAARFLLAGIAWIGTVHAVADTRILFLLFQVIGQWALNAALLWILYLALEPELRARWPHSIVTWNRLLAGRWKDAQVCAHVLAGAAVGVGIWIGAELTQIAFGGHDLDAEGGLDLTLGTRQWVASQADTLGSLLLSGFAIFLIVFGIRLLVRRNVLASILAAVAGVFLNLGADPERMLQHWQTLVPIYFVLFSVLIFVLLRLGLVAFSSAIFFLNSCGKIIAGADWSTWYAPYGLATLALLLGIALFAFWRSLGSRELLGNEAL
jgi:predicted Ser/Thr protein kinase